MKIDASIIITIALNSCSSGHGVLNIIMYNISPNFQFPFRFEHIAYLLKFMN